MKIEDLSTRKLARLLGITQRAVEDLARRGVAQRGDRSGPIWSSRRSRLNCQHLREQWNTTFIVDTGLNPGVSGQIGASVSIPRAPTYPSCRNQHERVRSMTL
jgi:hypothetical protein